MKRLMNLRPSKQSLFFLGLLPFVLIVLLYLGASEVRLAENPNDKLLPSMSSFAEAIDRMAFEPSKRTGEYLFVEDTVASLERLGLGVLISAVLALLMGIPLGFIPFVRAGLSPFVAAFSMVPPMAILPILFIIFGMGELAKVALIVIGVTPLIVRDLQQRVMEIPAEQLIKAQTLGGSSWTIVLRVVLPQIFPRLLDAVRLTMGTAWIFLISAEAISATEGLGYRIFLVRRYLSMDVILPYVAWITFLAFLFDYLLKRFTYKVFPWYDAGKEQS
ncbi:ABC transporter permease [Sulfurimonas sp. HSL-3221]|uniref:ABC transporter permease n=1 Tax=Sulfurimonadaceae TaxID=2771471 RepID=UPI001E31BB43|nr:ABC transporter permease [Sulfurimonas sp. HSL-3221]UFS63702.1 ABC transporter permease [Sulfurimonas sp. HSL-3221]